jgi:hypothetical protein
MTTNDWHPVPGGALRIPALPQSKFSTGTSLFITNLLNCAPFRSEAGQSPASRSKIESNLQ